MMPDVVMPEAKQAAKQAAAPLGLYVHWPFCRAKCPYCDFNSHLRDRVDHTRWAAALVRELETLAEQADRRGHHLSSIFIGGGTPSLMDPGTMARVIEAARSVFTLNDDAEITMEANPTSVEAARLNAFAEAGVNRLSMGIQSLNDDALTALGREHSAHEALDALDVARAVFPRVSADFIYARPGQSEADWDDELARILGLGLSHLSLYQLTLEPGTAFWSRHRRGLMPMPEDDHARALFDLTRLRCADAGLPAYEISNHANPGQESRHNLIYWRAHDWIGIGPGAFGRFWRDNNRVEMRCRRDPDAWLEGVERDGHGLDTADSDSVDDAAAEIFMMGLRLGEGVRLDRLTTLPGLAGGGYKHDALTMLEREGLITLDDGAVRLTDKGMPLINSGLSARIC